MRGVACLKALLVWRCIRQPLQAPFFLSWWSFASWIFWLWAFVSFRFFDIVKLGLVGWADKLGGALGVILDDILAGIAAAITLTALLILT